MLGQISTPNVSNPDRDQSDDCEQIEQGGGPEGEAGIHRVSNQKRAGTVREKGSDSKKNGQQQ
jgi:hypothetical protein